MHIHLEEHTVREVCNGFLDNDELGVYGFGGKLNIRPKYQREFVYNDEQQKAVINTVMRGFPLNVMYWVKNDEGNYELLDGQQRTMSLCKFVRNDFSIMQDNGMPASFENLTLSEQNKILDYKLLIYVCEGDDKERLDWFKTINIAGLELTDQELRNACYTGVWLTKAKERFSKVKCNGYAISLHLVRAEVNRQKLLEVALRWISEKERITIEDYMARHQHDTNADELWTYFKNVCDWADLKFKTRRKEMINQPWNRFYEDFKDKSLDADELEKEISTLLKDNEVTNKKGIYPYVLYKEPSHLNLRTFDDNIKAQTYERQGGICPMCEKEGNSKTHYELSEMQADHITPWSKGGKTEPDNCMMLCRKHNAMKSDH